MCHVCLGICRWNSTSATVTFLTTNFCSSPLMKLKMDVSNLTAFELQSSIEDMLQNLLNLPSCMCIFSHNLKLNENPNLLYCFVAWGNMWNVISFIKFFCLFGFGCNCNVQFGMNESCVQPLGLL